MDDARIHNGQIDDQQRKYQACYMRSTHGDTGTSPKAGVLTKDRPELEHPSFRRHHLLHHGICPPRSALLIVCAPLPPIIRWCSTIFTCRFHSLHVLNFDAASAAPSLRNWNLDGVGWLS